ncbi:MAG TPA: hypothetical protein H9691_10240 [Firmicutes bacterium]|nr:hypothetical protein [Bacillota bacterium]
MADEKKKNRKNKTEARVPVEEDLDLFGDHKPRRRVPRFIYRVALILLLCTVGLTLWLNRDNISLEGFWGWLQTQVVGTGYGGGYPASITGRETDEQNLVADNNQPAIVSDTEIMIFNSTAKELLTAQHSCASPVLCEAGGRYLVYDQGGTTYQIVSAQKVLKKGHSKQTIYAAALAGNGRWALATASQDYMSELAVYLEDGTQQYRYRFVDTRVTAVALSDDGTRGAAAAVTAQNGALVTKLYLFDFSQEEPVAIYESRDNFLYQLSMEGNRVCAIGDNSALTVAFGDEAPSEYTYNGTLCDAALHGDRMVLAISRYTGGTDIVEFDGGNDPITQFSVTGDVLSVDMNGSTLAVLTQGHVALYLSGTGDCTGEQDTDNDARALALGDGKTVYVLGAGEIRQIVF